MKIQQDTLHIWSLLTEQLKSNYSYYLKNLTVKHFRLDTTYTHSQNKSLSADSQEMTTHTDYVNKYSSVLQTSSYLFMGTETTLEQCAGVVKPHYVFEKTPSQHAADFKMVKSSSDFQFQRISIQTVFA